MIQEGGILKTARPCVKAYTDDHMLLVGLELFCRWKIFPTKIISKIVIMKFCRKSCAKMIEYLRDRTMPQDQYISKSIRNMKATRPYLERRMKILVIPSFPLRLSSFSFLYFPVKIVSNTVRCRRLYFVGRQALK